MRRRRFLKQAAAGGIGVAIAGCTGEGGGDPTPRVETVIRTVEGEERTVVVRKTPSPTPEAGLPSEIVVGHTSPAMPAHHMAMYPGYSQAVADQASVSRKVYSGHTPMIAGLLRGEISIGYNAPLSIINAISQGFPIKAIYGYQMQYTFSLIVNPDEVSGWSDMDGRSVAVHSPSSISTASTKVMAQEELGDADALELSYILGTPNRLAALQSGEVDAATVFLSGALQAEKDGYATILANPADYERLSRQMVSAWMTLDTVLENEPGRIESVVSYLDDAYQYAYDTDAADLVDGAIDTGYFGEFDRDVLIDAVTIMRDNRMWPVDGDLSSESINKAQDLLVDTGLLKPENRITRSEFVDDRFLG